MRVVPHQAEVPEEREDGSDPEDRRRRRFHYEEPSTDSELNAIDYSKNLDSVEAVWATVDSGAATSCLPIEMCRKMGLSILKTSDLPYTTASGQPVHVHGVCTPSVTLGAQGPQGTSISQELVSSRQRTWQHHCYPWPSW